LQIISPQFTKKHVSVWCQMGASTLKVEFASAAFALLCGIFASSCEAMPSKREREPRDLQVAVKTMENDGEEQDQKMTANRQFRTLDEYLAHLRKQSHMDGKWYREIRPGVYEVQTGNLHLDNDTQQRIFTRDELKKMFGFRN
jgi:hypothetical protein